MRNGPWQYLRPNQVFWGELAKRAGECRSGRRRISFQDEFLALLKNHRVEFDERYIWQ
jgi:hypothetical protein